jgi:hypothetical protein
MSAPTAIGGPIERAGGVSAGQLQRSPRGWLPPRGRKGRRGGVRAGYW